MKFRIEKKIWKYNVLLYFSTYNKAKIEKMNERIIRLNKSLTFVHDEMYTKKALEKYKNEHNIPIIKEM